MKRGDPFELDVLLVSYLNQEGFHPRQTFRDGLHDGGHDGRNSSTSRSVLFRHAGHSTRSGEQPVCCLAHIATLTHAVGPVGGSIQCPSAVRSGTSPASTWRRGRALDGARQRRHDVERVHASA